MRARSCCTRPCEGTGVLGSWPGPGTWDVVRCSVFACACRGAWTRGEAVVRKNDRTSWARGAVGVCDDPPSNEMSACLPGGRGGVLYNERLLRLSQTACLFWEPNLCLLPPGTLSCWGAGLLAASGCPLSSPRLSRGRRPSAPPKRAHKWLMQTRLGPGRSSRSSAARPTVRRLRSYGSTFALSA